MKRTILIYFLALFMIPIFAQEANKSRTLLITSGSPAAGWGSLNVNYSTNIFYVTSTGPVALSTNWSLSASGTAVAGLTYKFFYNADVRLGSNDISFFGVNLSELQSDKKLIIIASYLGTSWKVSILPDLSEDNGGIIGDDQLIIDASLDNSTISTTAAIEFSKMEALTVSVVPVLDASGFIVASTVSATELGYIDNLTSDAQAQINTKATSGAIVNADIAAGAAIGVTKLATLSTNRAVATDASGNLVATTITDTELGYLSGNTGGNIQAQLDAAAGKTLLEGSVYIGSLIDEVGAVDIKTSGNVLIGNGTTATSQAISGDATLTSGGVLTIGSSVVTPSNADDNLSYDLVFVTASFESGYTGDKKIRVPYNSNLTHAYICVEKLIEATNDAVLHFEDHLANNMGGGSLSGGDLTITAGSATGTIVQTDISSNNNFAAGETLTLETRKSTVGGTIWVSLRFERID